MKSVAEMENMEHCPTCGSVSERQFSFKVHFIGTKVTHAEWNPGLGCVVNNKRHKDYICKSRGLIEIGNDYGSGEKMQEKFDSDREKKLDKRWEED